MKKLVFTVTNDLNFDQRMIRICSSLSNNGYDVTLIGRKKKSSQPIQNQHFRQKRINVFFNSGILFYAFFNIQLFFYLLRKKTDLICAIDLDTLPAGFLAAKISGKKIVFDAHEYFEESPELVDKILVKNIWKKIGEIFIPKVDCAYTVAPKLGEIFSKKYSKKFEIIRNLPFNSIPEKKIGINSDKKVLLYQGVLNIGRGLESMMKIMPHLDDKFELWFVGEGDISQELRKMAKNLNIENNVRFLGSILPKDLKKITSQAYLGFNLLENLGLNYYYSLANKTFDYIQAGIPAIHMNFPEYLALQNTYEIGLLIDDLSEKALLNAINTFDKDENFYLQTKKNCLKAAKQLNWETEEKLLLKIYKNIFSNESK